MPNNTIYELLMFLFYFFQNSVPLVTNNINIIFFLQKIEEKEESLTEKMKRTLNERHTQNTQKLHCNVSKNTDAFLNQTNMGNTAPCESFVKLPPEDVQDRKGEQWRGLPMTRELVELKKKISLWKITEKSDNFRTKFYEVHKML